MDTLQHHLISPSCGTARSLHSWHFGAPGAGPKVYIQASLHADELPGMLVIQHLRQHLQQAEAAGQLRGQVVLVPMANPIGLDQTWLQLQMGRFEMASGQNFNRHYPIWVDWLRESGHDVATQLGPDAQANVRTVRQAMHQALLRHPPSTELDSLRHTLMGLACDADVVLDLHCDFEAVMHLYMEPECEAGLRPLAQWLGAQAVLLARGTGAHCFDESLSGVWWQLRESLLASHGSEFVATHPLPQACLSTTVELRGEADVIIDTSQLNVHQLRRRIIAEFAFNKGTQLSLLFESFAYKRGVPADADFVFDARVLPNPHWNPDLRPYAGRDPKVRAFLDAQPEVAEYVGQVSGFLDTWLPRLRGETRSYVTIAFGCTGGKHRSVYLAETLARHAREQGWEEVATFHRELD